MVEEKLVGDVSSDAQVIKSLTPISTVDCSTLHSTPHKKAMSYTLPVPGDYGYVVLAVGVGSFVVTTMMGIPVMKARKKNDVQYPNLYATPGYHKEADAFNRVQRGHQNMFESLSCVQTMSLLGGLKHPKVAAAGFCLYLAGCHFYMVGYSDMSLDVKTARYRRGGGLKWVGILAGMTTSISLAGSMLRWW